MERFWHLRALHRFWWVIVASILVAVGVAFVVTESGGGEAPHRTLYDATTKLYASESSGSGLVVRDSLSNPAIVIEFLEEDEVASRVKDALDSPASLEQLTSMVVGTVAEGTGLLEITATSLDPDGAEELSRAFADALLARLSELRHEDNLVQAEQVKANIRDLNDQLDQATEGADQGTLTTQLTQARSQYRALVDPDVDPGFKPLSTTTQAKPVQTTGFEAPRSLTVRAGIAALLGLLGGVALALIMGRLDTRIRTKRGAEDSFGLPVLAEIPVLPRRARTQLIAHEEPTSRFAEGFRFLGAELVRGRRSAAGGNGDDKAPRVIVVTSAGPGEGKTTVAANLAVALADMERRVIVLNCDLRRPRIHTLFDVQASPGLADVLDEDDGQPILDRVAASTKVEGVRLVPSGRIRSQPTELLNSPGLRRLIAEARASADMVVIDTTPLLAVSDAAFIAPEADVVLLVARSGHTTVEVARRTSELLARLGCNTVGVALNRAAETILPKGYRSYYERNPSRMQLESGNDRSIGQRKGRRSARGRRRAG